MNGQMGAVAAQVCERQGHRISYFTGTESFCIQCGMTLSEIRGETEKKYKGILDDKPAQGVWGAGKAL